MDFFPAVLTTISATLPAGHVRSYIAPGDLGTAQTIFAMQKAVGQGKRDFRVRALVGQLIQGCSHKNFQCYAERIFGFCRDKILYAYDPHGVELIEMPWKVIEAGIADCDSICILFSSMCESIGLPCEFVTIKSDPKRPEEYSHVYCRVRIPPGRWVSADATVKNPFGWEAPATFAKKFWPASLDDGEIPTETAGIGAARMRGYLGVTQDECACNEGSVWRNGQCLTDAMYRMGPPLRIWKDGACYQATESAPTTFIGSQVVLPSGRVYAWDTTKNAYAEDIAYGPYSGYKGYQGPIPLLPDTPKKWIFPLMLCLGAVLLLSRRT